VIREHFVLQRMFLLSVYLNWQNQIIQSQLHNRANNWDPGLGGGGRAVGLKGQADIGCD